MNIEQHLERLKRHYEASVRTYDEVSFLDLAHVLRLWMELKTELHDTSAFAKSCVFKTAVPVKKVRHAIRDFEHVAALMPGGVVTYASQGHLARLPKSSFDKDHTSCAQSRIRSDGAVEMKNFIFAAVLLGDELLHALKLEDLKSLNYLSWCGAEIVRVRCENKDGVLESFGISREHFIKRVANTLGGSHPVQTTIANSAYANCYDAPVQYLLRYGMGGIPLPYFLLLKVAQDIVSIVPTLLRRP